MSASMTSPATATPNDSHPDFSPAEWQARIELAACFRLLAKFRMTDLTATHATVRIPDTEDHILINPYGLLFEEITASCLVKMDLEGNILSNTEHPPVSAGFAIHGAVHRARPDAVCTVHTHTRAGTGVAALACGLLPVNQMSLVFYDRVAYNDYAFLMEIEECGQLVRDLGDKNVMLMRNHGLLTAGGSVGEAFMRMYYLDKACEIQLDALATGRELELPPPEVCEEAAQRSMVIDGHPFGEVEWTALVRQLDRDDPSYRS